MNCPGGMLTYRRRPWSYKDLPLRLAELGLVHRHELSGALHGLFRVRCFTQDDAHISRTPEQMEAEITGVIAKIDYVYRLFGFKYSIELSTCPEEFIGTQEIREFSEGVLKTVLEKAGREYTINPGDGAFYGPKIDFHLEDAIGRTWQCGTIQLDFQMPERFELDYTDADGSKKRPVMIHTVTYGSFERFLGILTEHYAGAFPLWLSPVQAVVLPVTDRVNDYADSVAKTLRDAGLRVETDTRSEKIGYKIRHWTLQKAPYMLIVGDKEAESATVSVRSRSGDEGAAEIANFAARVTAEYKNRVM
jgi:threonyl-tRNA synthetase